MGAPAKIYYITYFVIVPILYRYISSCIELVHNHYIYIYIPVTVTGTQDMMQQNCTCMCVHIHWVNRPRSQTWLMTWLSRFSANIQRDRMVTFRKKKTYSIYNNYSSCG